MVQNKLEFGKNHFSYIGLMVHGGIESKLGQTGVALVWHPFYLESTCLNGVATPSILKVIVSDVHGVLGFGKDLNN